MTTELIATLTALSARLQAVNDLDLVAGRIRKAAEAREKQMERGDVEGDWSAVESLFRLARVLDSAASDLQCADGLIDQLMDAASVAIHVTPAVQVAE